MIRFQSKRQAFLCALSWAFAVACMALIFIFLNSPVFSPNRLAMAFFPKFLIWLGC